MRRLLEDVEEPILEVGILVRVAEVDLAAGTSLLRLTVQETVGKLAVKHHVRRLAPGLLVLLLRVGKTADPAEASVQVGTVRTPPPVDTHAVGDLLAARGEALENLVRDLAADVQGRQQRLVVKERLNRRLEVGGLTAGLPVVLFGQVETVTGLPGVALPFDRRHVAVVHLAGHVTGAETAVDRQVVAFLA